MKAARMTRESPKVDEDFVFLLNTSFVGQVLPSACWSPALQENIQDCAQMCM